MIGIDTNILVRLIIKDDQKQYLKVLNIIEKECSVDNPGFISAIVLCELAWVLGSRYKYTKPLLSQALYNIITTREFFIEHQNEAWSALEDYKNNHADFSDYYVAHISKKHGATKILTFDQKAATHNLFKLIK